MMETKVWRHFDPYLLVLILVLMLYGVLMVHSATFQPDRQGMPSDLAYRQLGYGVLGLFGFAVVVTIDYRILGNFATAGYILMGVLLVVVLALGRISHGAQRWIDLGIFPLQPSELAKLFLIIALAKYFSDHEEDIRQFRYVLFSLILVAIPFVLTFLQPDLGSAAILVFIWVGMAVMAGVRLMHWLILGIFAAALSPVLWLSMHDYMKTRLTIFLDPHSDPLGAGYNVIQALTAVGSGGWIGRGFTSGTQSQLHFLRVQYADFIFSVLAEELGFIGAMALFLLFVVLLLRCLRVAGLSSDSFGRLISIGVVSWMMSQVLVNVGMNIGLLPVTGVPLPFISYGGSSLIITILSIGILESVVMRHKKIEF
ncbi:MAG: rod shape-determining protein RodA [Chloroflexi bacterium]|nr:rod shape-determining protein RodA [Chloroflexota bacterium]